jgi:hypothetical protein
MTWCQFFAQLAIAVAAAGVAAGVAIWGWSKTHKYSIERDHKNREKETRIAYLVDAYDKLALYANRVPTPEFSRMLEIAVEKIQLFGTAEEIGHLHAFLDEWAQTAAAGRARASIDPLLKALRNRLREELALAPVPADRDNIRWIRPEGGAQ